MALKKIIGTLKRITNCNHVCAEQIKVVVNFTSVIKQ